MAARGVLSEHRDEALPHVAFFATRDIAAGEELTYCGRVEPAVFGD